MASDTAAASKHRVVVVDALRGLALSGIVLLHHIEHFNFYWTPTKSPASLAALDAQVWDAAFLLISGKAFALFSLIFGFSFWLQYESRKAKGETYAYRFVWRMALLFLLGMFHTLFFSGDILFLYALLSFPLIIACDWPKRYILILAGVLLTGPAHLASLISYAVTGSALNLELSGYYWDDIDSVLSSGSFVDAVAFNFRALESNILWSWNEGRIFLIPGLFLLGLYFARSKIFEKGDQFWRRMFFAMIVVSFVFWAAIAYGAERINDEAARATYRSLFNTALKTSASFIWMSGAILVWRTKIGAYAMHPLAQFGRMGLTNYILSSAIGGFLYHHWGLGLYDYVGSTQTLGIAFLVLSFQIVFSMLWLNRFKQGPLEWLWRKATWFKFN